jgi:hypothetical protein
MIGIQAAVKGGETSFHFIPTPDLKSSIFFWILDCICTPVQYTKSATLEMSMFHP